MIKTLVEILLTVAIILGALFIVPTTFAVADLTITCNTTSCSSSPLGGPVFSESNMVPLGIVTRTVRAENTSGADLDFAIEVRGSTFSDSTPPLSESLTITITEQESSTVVYGPKTIKEWKDSGFTVLSTIPAGGAKTYELLVSLGDVGNDLQGKQLSFDLSLGFDTVGTVLGEETKRSEVLGVVLPATGTPLANLVLAALAFGIGLRLRRRVKRLSSLR